ncbi:hypothetical protein ONA70_10005 [Micromonospora yasonensis]|nr:hypothetical protein [Micromonospora yasonensis]MCW3840427.1 hypothetical protein [Micromonospora yasonensis]
MAGLFIRRGRKELVGSCESVLVLRDGAIAGQLTGSNVTEKGIMALLAAT